MNNENYIVINGKKAELTEEQLEQLGVEVKPKRNSPFDRVPMNSSYYHIGGSDNIVSDPDKHYDCDERYFDNSNYFNDKDFANQVMLHQQLYRKLLKYAYDNNAEVTEEDWEKGNYKNYISCGTSKEFYIDSVVHISSFGTVYFKNRYTATNAIKNVIEPFMKEHPEFVW